MTALKEIRKNPHILEFIKQTESVLSALGFTDHGLRHSNLTAGRARAIVKGMALNKREGEMAAISAFCHDMGNFLSRTYHNYFGALLFQQVFGRDIEPKELTTIMQAISNHDKKIEDIAFVSPVSAIVVLADKSDVHRSRVIVKSVEEIKNDIHNRVNYATRSSNLKVDKSKKRITLTLKIDTKFVPIIEYFEIFTDRMIFCRKAAEYLGYSFGLVINNFKLL